MRCKPALYLYLVLCLALPLLGAESFPLTAGKFKVLLSPIGGKLMSLEYDGVTYSQPLSNNGSFYDRLYFSSEQKETMEDFGKLRYEVESWRSDAKGAEVTFTVCGVAMLNFIRLHKTYQFPAQGDTCKITYTLTNLSQQERSVGITNRNFFRRMDEIGMPNNFYQHRQEGRYEITYPGTATRDEWGLNPAFSWMAFAGKDGKGALITLPPQKLSAFYQWFGKDVFTQEWFTREMQLAPGDSLSYTVEMQFTDDINTLLSNASRPELQVRNQIGKPALYPLIYSGNLPEGKNVLPKNAPDSVSANFVDVSVKRQSHPSIRSVRFLAGADPELICVRETANGHPMPDRLVPFSASKLDNGEVQVLVRVPGFNPEGVYYSKLQDGYALDTRRRNRVQAYLDFTFRITLGEKCPVNYDQEQFAAGPNLLYNGNFEIPAQNANFPDGFFRQQVYAQKNPAFFWEAAGGCDNSRCLRIEMSNQDSRSIFDCEFIPEPGRSYTASAWIQVDNPLHEWTNVSISFQDAQGQPIQDRRIRLKITRESYRWSKISETFMAPDNAVSASLYFRTYRPGQTMLVDNVSIVPEEIPAQPVSRLESLRRQLMLGFYKPLELLETISHQAVTAHEKWFTPAADALPELLYLSAINSSPEDTTRRTIVELSQRMELTYNFIPLLRKIENINSTGFFGVNGSTMAPVLEEYVLERLRLLPETPKLVLVQGLNFSNQVQPEFVDILQGMQDAGAVFLFLDCSEVPEALAGAPVPLPPGVLAVPELSKVSRRSLAGFLEFRQRGNARCAILNQNFLRGNPSVPKEMNRQTYYSYYGRDFPFWEYTHLAICRTLRALANITPDASVSSISLAGEQLQLQVQAATAVNATLVLDFRGMHREQDGVSRQACQLAAGNNTLNIDLPPLPAGTHILHYQLLNPEQKILDAGAFRFDTTAAYLIEAAEFAIPERIFERGKPINFTVKITPPPEGCTLECIFEDTDFRETARESRSATAVNEFSVNLPGPYTTLCRIALHLKKDGRLLARRWEEISLPGPALEITDVHGYMWIARPQMNEILRDLGFDMVSSGYRQKNIRSGLFRNLRNLDLAPGPIGSGRVFGRPEVDYEGDPVTAPIRKPCFSDPELQRAAKEIILQTAQEQNYRYYDVKHHFLQDEAGLGQSVCYSPHCLKAFREHLQVVYPSLQALNQEWGCQFPDWEAVTPVQFKELPDQNRMGRWLDHKMFMSWTFAHKWCGSVISALKEAVPGTKAGLSGTQNPGYGYDWVQMMPHFEFLAYYSGIQRTLVHSFSPPGFKGGQWSGGYTPAHIRYEQYNHTTLWDNLFRGAGLIPNWHGSAMLGDLTPSESLCVYSETLKEIKRGAGKLVLSAKESPEVAVLYSHASFFAAVGTIGSNEWQQTQNSWNALLSDLKIPFRFLAYNDLAQNGVPANYKVVILPAVLSLSDQESTALRQFVERGGTLLADFAPGRFNQHGTRGENPILSRLFPTSSTAIAPLARELTINGVTGKFRLAEAEVPVFSEKKLGSGRAILANLMPGGYQNINLGGGGEVAMVASGAAQFCLNLRRIFSSLLQECGVTPLCRITTLNGELYPCMTILRQDGPNYVFGLLQTNYQGTKFDFDKFTEVKVELPCSGYIYSVREGKYIGQGNSFTCNVVDGWSQLYSIMPTQPTELQLELPSSLPRGAMLSGEYVLNHGTGPLVFHLELLDPKAKPVRLFSRNMRSSDNCGSFSGQIAWNAEPGAWTVQIINVNTGLKAEKTFIVE